MTALTAEKVTPYRKGLDFGDPVEAAVTCWAGAIIGINAAGNAQPGGSVAGLVTRGVCLETQDNSTGAAGDLTVTSRTGVFRVQQDASITREQILTANAYVIDDQTVSLDGTGGRALAGPIVDLDSSGVWIDFGGTPAQTSKTYVAVAVGDVKGTGSYYAVAPIGGKVTKVWSTINAALTTADATLTTKIAGTAITGGAIDVVQASSAAGQVNSAVPTAANAVTAGQSLGVTVSGSEGTDVVGIVLFEITH